MPSMYDELHDPEANPDNRPDFSEDELAELAQAREDEARLTHFLDWCHAHQVTPERLTSRQCDQIFAEWHAREQRRA